MNMNRCLKRARRRLFVVLLVLFSFWFLLTLYGNTKIFLPARRKTSLINTWPTVFRCPFSPAHNHKSLKYLLKRADQVSPKWMLRNVSKYVFLAEALQVRIYDSDKAKWTIRELKQWIHYMLWAGVQHIYLCDHYQFHHERLDVPLKKYIDLDLVTYIPWNVTGTAMDAQISCYRHIKQKYQFLTKWIISVDMDEYPFVADDYEEGFLSRYLVSLEPEVKVVLLHNFLMLGVGDRTRDMVTERINRITMERANKLDKPIFQPEFAHPGIHQVFLKGPGKEIHGREDKIYMAHYWGGRLQNWGPDTVDILNKTVEFNDLRDFVSPYVRISLLVFGECDSFSYLSGP